MVMVLPAYRARGAHKSRKLRPYVPTVVEKPFRAVSKKVAGPWRDDIELAMLDAKKLPMPCRVVSHNNVMLARFESGLRAADKERDRERKQERERECERERKTES